MSWKLLFSLNQVCFLGHLNNAQATNAAFLWPRYSVNKTEAEVNISKWEALQSRWCCCSACTGLGVMTEGRHGTSTGQICRVREEFRALKASPWTSGPSWGGCETWSSSIKWSSITARTRWSSSSERMPVRRTALVQHRL